MLTFDMREIQLNFELIWNVIRFIENRSLKEHLIWIERK